VPGRFAPDFTQNIRTLFDARQSEADRLGLERSCRPEAINPADLLQQFEAVLHPAVQRFRRAAA
jgi:hypothetical protein